MTRRPRVVVGIAVAVLVAGVVAGVTGWVTYGRDGGGTGEGSAMTASGTAVTEVSADDLRKVTRTRVFFGHQSVGANLLSGVPGVFAAHGVASPPVAEGATTPGASGGFVDHALIGRNGAPQTKIEAFDAAIRGGLGARVDVAILKLCYVDVTAGTDVDALFATYRDTMDALARDYPDVTFVKATVPVTTEPGRSAGLKAMAKKLLGEQAGGRADNVARQRFNALVRARYAGDHLFDLAAAESTAPDGSRVSGTVDGQGYLALFDGYAADEGHLGPEGARRVATAWLAAVAAASSR